MEQNAPLGQVEDAGILLSFGNLPPCYAKGFEPRGIWFGGSGSGTCNGNGGTERNRRPGEEGFEPSPVQPLHSVLRRRGMGGCRNAQAGMAVGMYGRVAKAFGNEN